MVPKPVRVVDAGAAFGRKVAASEALKYPSGGLQGRQLTLPMYAAERRNLVMRRSRSIAVVLSVLALVALVLAVMPNPLHQVLAGARVAIQKQSPTLLPQAERPGSGSKAPSGATPGVLVLTPAGRPLRANLLASAAKTIVPGPGHALGHGSTLLGTNQLEFQFAAQGDPFDAQGHAFFQFPGFIDSKGPVDCLDVIGTRAYLSGPLQRQVIPGFSRWILFVDDMDVADKESSSPDRIGLAISIATPLPDCTNPSFQSVVTSSAFPFSKGKVEADQER